MTTEAKSKINQWFRGNIITIVIVISGFIYTQIEAKAQIESAIKVQKETIEEMKDDIKEIQRDIKELLKNQNK